MPTKQELKTNTKKQFPKSLCVNPWKLILFVFMYVVSYSLPLVLSYFMALFASKLESGLTIEQLFSDQIGNGLLFGVISLLLISFISFFIYFKKVSAQWKSTVATISGITMIVVFFALVFLGYTMFVIPISSRIDLTGMVPNSKIVFFVECVSLFLCVTIQGFTHPDFFLE